MLMNPAESGCVPEAGSKPLSTKAISQAFAIFFFCISEVSFIFIYALGQWDFFSVVQCCGCKCGDSGLRAAWGLSSFFFFFLTLMRKMMTVFQLSLHTITMIEEMSFTSNRDGK